MEYAVKGELFDEVNIRGAFSSEIGRFFFRKMLAAIDHIHSNRIAHLDLKPANILLDNNFNIKIADFGISGLLNGDNGDGFFH